MSVSKVGGKEQNFPSYSRDLKERRLGRGGDLRHLESKDNEVGLVLGRQGLKRKKLSFVEPKRGWSSKTL